MFTVLVMVHTGHFTLHTEFQTQRLVHDYQQDQCNDRRVGCTDEDTFKLIPEAGSHGQPFNRFTAEKEGQPQCTDDPCHAMNTKDVECIVVAEFGFENSKKIFTEQYQRSCLGNCMQHIYK